MKTFLWYVIETDEVIEILYDAEPGNEDHLHMFTAVEYGVFGAYFIGEL